MPRNLTRVIGILAFVAIPVSALAQQSTTPPPPTMSQKPHGGIGVGVKGGPLFSSIDQVNIADPLKGRTGFIGGLFLGGNRHGVVGVGVDLLYARKGAKDPNSSTALDLDYLNVPVYLRINIGTSSLNGFSLYGTAGADLNFLIKSKLSTGTDVKDEFERADYGMAFGLGMEITRLVIEGRYTKGLGNIAKDKSAPVLKTQTFAIMLGVRFH